MKKMRICVKKRAGAGKHEEKELSRHQPCPECAVDFPAASGHGGPCLAAGRHWPGGLDQLSESESGIFC